MLKMLLMLGFLLRKWVTGKALTHHTGPGGLERQSAEQGNVGAMGIHPTTTPIIEVAGDGKTAKGVWIGTGFVASKDRKTGKPHAIWEWDRYGVNSIKEDGKWKMWHFNGMIQFASPYEKSWVWYHYWE